MTNNVNFDELARKNIASNGAMEDLNNLYGAVFALSDWHFIARGELPNVSPYIAANAEYADGQYMVRAFTDTERLQRFAKENNLTEPDGSALILSIPTGKAVEYLEQFIAEGVHGVWFNSDTASDGFFVPLRQLRPIKEHLEKLNTPKSFEKKQPIETLLITVRDGLMFPSGFVAPSSYACNFFCRVPADWVEGERLKADRLEKIYQRVYGETWRTGNSDGSQYVVEDAYTQIFTPETVKTTKWSGTVNDNDNHFWFYLVTENGEVKSVTAEEFQADVDAEFRADAEFQADVDAEFKPSAPKQVSYISSFEQGTVKPDTSLTPFFRAIAPLLENYAGSGEFSEAFSRETGEKAPDDLFEDVARNSHGAYLKYQSFTDRGFGVVPPVEIKHIGSNLLQHVETREKLLVNLTLSKESAQAKLTVRFLGPESVVESLLKAVKPVLESCDFQVSVQMKEPPPAVTLKSLGIT